MLSHQPSAELRNFLKLPKASNWLYYEWFYSDMDRALFSMRNDFWLCFKATFPNLHINQLSKHEWRYVRRCLGKPRRCSHAFFNEERKALKQKRDKMRSIWQLDYDKTMNIKSITSIGHFINQLSTDVRTSPEATTNALISEYFLADIPACVPHPPIIGAKVIARIREPCTGMYTGRIVAIDHWAWQYRVCFDQPFLGTQSVPDYEIQSWKWYEPIMASFNIFDSYQSSASNAFEIDNNKNFANERNIITTNGTHLISNKFKVLGSNSMQTVESTDSITSSYKGSSTPQPQQSQLSTLDVASVVNLHAHLTSSTPTIGYLPANTTLINNATPFWVNAHQSNTTFSQLLNGQSSNEQRLNNNQASQMTVPTPGTPHFIYYKEQSQDKTIIHFQKSKDYPTQKIPGIIGANNGLLSHFVSPLKTSNLLTTTNDNNVTGLKVAIPSSVPKVIGNATTILKNTSPVKSLLNKALLKAATMVNESSKQHRANELNINNAVVSNPINSNDHVNKASASDLINDARLFHLPPNHQHSTSISSPSPYLTLSDSRRNLMNRLANTLTANSPDTYRMLVSERLKQLQANYVRVNNSSSPSMVANNEDSNVKDYLKLELVIRLSALAKAFRIKMGHITALRDLNDKAERFQSTTTNGKTITNATTNDAVGNNIVVSPSQLYPYSFKKSYANLIMLIHHTNELIAQLFDDVKLLEAKFTKAICKGGMFEDHVNGNMVINKGIKREFDYNKSTSSDPYYDHATSLVRKLIKNNASTFPLFEGFVDKMHTSLSNKVENRLPQVLSSHMPSASNINGKNKNVDRIEQMLNLITHYTSLSLRLKSGPSTLQNTYEGVKEETESLTPTPQYVPDFEELMGKVKSIKSTILMQNAQNQNHFQDNVEIHLNHLRQLMSQDRHI